jgi:hypothetical protein
MTVDAGENVYIALVASSASYLVVTIGGASSAPRVGSNGRSISLSEPARSADSPCSLGRLGAELIPMNLNGDLVALAPDYSPARHQPQRTAAVQFRGPAYRNLHAASSRQEMSSRKQHSRARYVDGFAFAGFVAVALAQDAVAHLALDGESVGVAAIGMDVLFWLHTLSLPCGDRPGNRIRASLGTVPRYRADYTRLHGRCFIWRRGERESL